MRRSLAPQAPRSCTAERAAGVGPWQCWEPSTRAPGRRSGMDWERSVTVSLPACRRQHILRRLEIAGRRKFDSPAENIVPDACPSILHMRQGARTVRKIDARRSGSIAAYILLDDCCG